MGSLFDIQNGALGSVSAFRLYHQRPDGEQIVGATFCRRATTPTITGQPLRQWQLITCHFPSGIFATSPYL